MFRTPLCPSSGASFYCTCSLWSPEIKFYDFKTDVHLLGFYSILSLGMHGAMNVKFVYTDVT
jgi:hypothetical protein